MFDLEIVYQILVLRVENLDGWPWGGGSGARSGGGLQVAAGGGERASFPSPRSIALRVWCGVGEPARSALKWYRRPTRQGWFCRCLARTMGALRFLPASLCFLFFVDDWQMFSSGL
jgi:hypothetical protein